MTWVIGVNVSLLGYAAAISDVQVTLAPRTIADDETASRRPIALAPTLPRLLQVLFASALNSSTAYVMD
jgi:hypothetical protein